ncbi:Pentatricopeptide repeat-containing protein [Seminavis robusta]|uniref:Pentatricopeptide repeat-containing protein n=1 Tax=Seminavis robusta TaxID=568900 RepID=A0A9N8DN92_9STRA|nr:Pentatricopeptide repeat-containing protein [Seminavis robusta]|eukprot:Sro239_g095880.1 Pentatricopeptide repeat-containing protein (724) ;mRNA; f:39466-41637
MLPMSTTAPDGGSLGNPIYDTPPPLSLTNKSTTITGIEHHHSSAVISNHHHLNMTSNVTLAAGLSSHHYADESVLQALLSSEDANVGAFAQALQDLVTALPAGTAARRAESWLSQLHKKEEPSSHYDNNYSNTNNNESPSIKSWRQGHATTASHLSTNTTGGNDLQAILQCHLVVIQAWANSKEDPLLTVKRAERWLEQAHRIASQQQQSAIIQETLTECYNAYLDLCSKGQKSDRRKRSHGRTLAETTQDTLERMVEEYHWTGMVRPNTDTINFVMRAITKTNQNDMAERTGELLRRMETSVEEKERLCIPPNAKSYCLWLTSLATVAQIKARRYLKEYQRKDAHLIEETAVHGDNNNGLRELKTILDAVMFRTRGDMAGALVDGNDPYNILLRAWSNLAGLHTNKFHGPLEAEKVFRTMVELSKERPTVAPDATSYQMVIRAWAKSKDHRAGEKAQWWLEKQWADFQQQQSGNDNNKVMPTTRTYFEAIMAWTAAGYSYKADALLMELKQRHKEQTDPIAKQQLKPTTEIYGSVIRAWLRTAESHPQGQSGQIGSLTMAVDWLDHLIQEEKDGGDLMVTSDLFQGVLKAATACAHGSPPVAELAKLTLDLSRRSSTQTHPYNYAYVAEAIILAHTWPEDDAVRTQLLTKVVKDCCDDGLVSKRLIRTLSNSTTYRTGWTKYESARLLNELFPDRPMPASWTRNVRQETLLPRVRDFERNTK